MIIFCCFNDKVQLRYIALLSGTLQLKKWTVLCHDSTLLCYLMHPKSQSMFKEVVVLLWLR